MSDPVPANKTVTPQKVAETIITDVAQGEKDYQQAAPAIQEVEDTAKPLGKEPALIVGTGLGVVIAVLALTGVVNVDTSVGVVTSVVPLIGGFITRFFVTPA